MTIDSFQYDNPWSSARKAALVAPSDTAELAEVSKALYVGVSGDLTVSLVGSTTPVLFKNAPVGYHPIRATSVKATGTTATNIVALS